MRELLTPPFLAAGLVLVVAAIAKLRSPAAAARALARLGWVPAWAPARSAWLVRAAAVIELGLGAWCVLAPGPAPGGLAAALYLVFAALTAVLARVSAGCGCFGVDVRPASIAQSVISGALAVVCLAGAFVEPHGASWLLGRSAAIGALMGLGVVACAYGLVVAYTELPAAWSAWSVQ